MLTMWHRFESLIRWRSRIQNQILDSTPSSYYHPTKKEYSAVSPEDVKGYQDCFVRLRGRRLRQASSNYLTLPWKLDTTPSRR